MFEAYGSRVKLSKPTWLVKAGQCFAFSSLFFALTLFIGPAQVANAAALEEIAKIKSDEEDLGGLPAIETKTYDVSVVRHSRSNKVYLFNDSQGTKPAVGKLMLLRQDALPVMAFRVMKAYPDKSQFAAVKVRTYGNFTELQPSQVLLAVEKLSDTPDVPDGLGAAGAPSALEAPTADELADVKEIEDAPDKFPAQYDTAEILAYDPELDAGSSPPPGALAAEPVKGKEETTDIGSDEDVSVDEVDPIDRFSNWLTFGVGLLSSTVPDESHPPFTRSTYFTGAGLRYGRTLAHHPFLYTKKIQDSLVLEAGAFYYRIVNLTGLGDAYTVLSSVGTIRYSLQLGENYTLFAYAGAFYHAVLSSSAPADGAIESIQGATPAVGIGGSILIGPSWHLRLDAGIDIVAIGLMLRY